MLLKGYIAYKMPMKPDSEKDVGRSHQKDQSSCLPIPPGRSEQAATDYTLGLQFLA